MIYDCFLYDGEKELLEIRINELSSFGMRVTHVIIEANVTHTGQPKEPYFTKQKKDFEQYGNIIHYVVEDMPLGATPREREAYQRNYINTVLGFIEAKDDDIIIISDVDEIPKAEKVKRFLPSMQFSALMMDKYAFFVNCVESWQSWDRARIMLYGYLKFKAPEEVRNSGYDYVITQAGWHYSWVIDPLRKLKSFSHTELDTDENEEKIKNKENIWNDDKFRIVDVNLSHPRYLYDNQRKFRHLIAKSL